MPKEPKCPITNMVCPRNGDPKAGKYCPAWTEYAETNLQTGEERITKECVFKAMPKFLIEVVKASNRPAAAVESTRNEIARGFEQLNDSVRRLPQALEHKRDADR